MRFLLLSIALLATLCPPPMPWSAGRNGQAAEPAEQGEEQREEQSEEQGAATGEDVLAGHSFHGEAFNEGPRQAAYLMPGMGQIDFPVSTEVERAQQFINQGIAQLHGFWYYEAERSFRQAAQLDPECAMCYWGMAMANVENRERAREFIAQAVRRQKTASEREQQYIKAYEKFCRDKDEQGKKIEKKERAQAYTHDLEGIVLEYPDDVDARAFLALQLWQNGRAGLPIVSHVAINSLLQEVFDDQPMHPAHHYRIHLWDQHQAKRALESAARCGPSLPGIAHMWHMPGHIYSKLHRYQDAVWQQEASARVDHAHMIRDRVLPDQIHNYAHNNEWLIRNLLKVGRIEDALSLAKNMLELPRHPKYNTLKKGSTKYGRERLLLSLTTYRLWPELIALSQTMYLEAGDDPNLQRERRRYLGFAYALSQQAEEAQELLNQLQKELCQCTAAIRELEAADEADKAKGDAQPDNAKAATDASSTDASSVDESSTDASPTNESPTDASSTVSKGTEKSGAEGTGEQATGEQATGGDCHSPADAQKSEANRKRRAEKRAKELKELQEQQKELEQAQATIQAGQAAAAENWQAALDLWEPSGLKDNLLQADWLAQSGQVEEALKTVDKEISKNPNEVLPHAVKTWLHYVHQGPCEARTSFAKTRELAGTADLRTPLLARLLPLATELQAGESWAAEPQPDSDIGQRPEFDALGPFRWQPYQAPDFTVTAGDERPVQLKQFSGKPTIIIFYLGFGCLHCVEQLHAFSPRAEQFRESGIEVVAISSENLESLNTALSSYTEPLDIPLHADPELTAFKAYRCFDDFEQQPLHGTFLLDPKGRVLWQDISYEPFMDVDFTLAESHRLLKLAGFGDRLQVPKPQKLISAGK